MISRAKEEALLAVQKVVQVFLDLGFIIRPKKSLLIPSQEIEFRGFVLDSVNLQVRLAAKKKVEIVELCSNLLAGRCHTIRYVAAAMGKLVAALPVVQYGKLY